MTSSAVVQESPIRVVVAVVVIVELNDNRQITVDNRPVGAAAKYVCWEQVYWCWSTLTLVAIVLVVVVVVIVPH